MFEVTQSWMMPVNIGVILIFLGLILWGAHQGFLLMIVSLLGTVASFFGAWFLGGILADYIRLWPRQWAVLQNTPLAAASWQFMNQVCWFLALFVVLRIIFMFITMMAKGLQDVPLIKQISQVLGGAVGAAEAMIFVLVLSIAFNSPLFKNGETAVQNALSANVNEISGKVYDKLLDPMMDADAFNRAYENAAEMTNEQRDNLRRWLEEKGYVSDVEGYTVVTEPAAEAETEEAETEGD